ncbi:hypothetical protein GJAV_G00009640 [Gymnothorax javanicus]|nr:hypothetical protein GJAV_G00009640 [Gymnothorax javanicus]
MLLAVFNTLIPDHAADAFSPPRREEPRLLDGGVEALLGGLSRWDAEHFLFIAERGYVFEHNHAFFPLLPLSLRATAAILLWPLEPWLTVRGRLLLAVVLLNGALFLLSMVALYALTRAVLGDQRVALLSSLLFCLSPANVFLAAGYSESLFCTLTLGGLWMLEMGYPLRASLVLSLATATRANGLVNAGFLIYLPLRWGLFEAGGICKGTEGPGRVLRLGGVAVRFLFTAAVGSTLIAIPFVVFQLYGYWTFCSPTLLPEGVAPGLLTLAEVKGYRVPDSTRPPPPWCHAHPPLLYSYIQEEYWELGFLRYFQLRQTPNFLLALPITLLVATAAWSYAAACPTLCLRLGLWGHRQESEKPASGFLSPRAFVYVVHATVLLVSGFFCMHVQVLTRFLASSSPVLYWFSAHLLLEHEPLLQEQEEQLQEEQSQEQEEELQEEQSQEQKWPCSFVLFSAAVGRRLPHNPVTQLLLQWRTCSPYSRWLLGYFTSYWMLGLVLHSNFLPWT